MNLIPQRRLYAFIRLALEKNEALNTQAKKVLEEARNVRHIKAENIELSADLEDAMNEVVALAILDALKKSLDALYISGRVTINKRLIDKVVLKKGDLNENKTVEVSKTEGSGMGNAEGTSSETKVLEEGK